MVKSRGFHYGNYNTGGVHGSTCTQENILRTTGTSCLGGTCRCGHGNVHVCMDCRAIPKKDARSRHGYLCKCTGNTPECDAFKDPSDPPCSCWYCVDKRKNPEG